MTMTLERAKEILEAYGGNAECWPDEEREALRRFLELSDEGRKLRADEIAVDYALATLEDVPVPSTLKADLMSVASEQLVGTGQTATRPVTPLQWAMEVVREFLFTIRSPAIAGGMALVLVAGVWFGSSLGFEPLEDEEMLTAFGEDYGLWTEEEDPFEVDLSGETL